MTPTEERNLERTRHWEWAWNHDAMRMVDECYAAGCEVTDMLRGRTFHGREELRAVEQQMLAVDPTRRMEITRMVARDDVVAIEMDSYWVNDSRLARACVFLTFDDDGWIVSDHSYGGDPVGAAERDPRA